MRELAEQGFVVTKDSTLKNALRDAAARNGDSYVHTRWRFLDGAIDLAEQHGAEPVLPEPP